MLDVVLNAELGRLGLSKEGSKAEKIARLKKAKELNRGPDEVAESRPQSVLILPSIWQRPRNDEKNEDKSAEDVFQGIGGLNLEDEKTANEDVFKRLGDVAKTPSSSVWSRIGSSSNEDVFKRLGKKVEDNKSTTEDVFTRIGGKRKSTPEEDSTTTVKRLRGAEEDIVDFTSTYDIDQMEERARRFQDIDLLASRARRFDEAIADPLVKVDEAKVKNERLRKFMREAEAEDCYAHFKQLQL